MGIWPAAAIDRLLVVFQGEAGGGRPAEGTEGPTGGRAVFHGNFNQKCSFFCAHCVQTVITVKLMSDLKPGVVLSDSKSTPGMSKRHLQGKFELFTAVRGTKQNTHLNIVKNCLFFPD